jgi:hypothetical protein
MPLASDCFVGAKITGGGDFANGFLPVPSSPCHQPVFQLFRGGDEKASAASIFFQIGICIPRAFVYKRRTPARAFTGAPCWGIVQR